MGNDTQDFVVESKTLAEELNAKHVWQAEMIPADFSAAGICNPVIWLEEPNVVGKGRCATLYRAASSDRRERP